MFFFYNKQRDSFISIIKRMQRHDQLASSKWFMNFSFVLFSDLF